MSADNWTRCPKCGKDFREDYEIGVWDGKFEVDYSGYCEPRRGGCGYEFKFSYGEEIKP